MITRSKQVQETINLYKKMGILKDCKSIGIIWDRSKNLWECNGHFQNENGRRNGMVAQFEKTEDAVDFQTAFQQGEMN